VEAADKFEAMAKVETMRWAAVGAQRTVKDICLSPQGSGDATDGGRPVSSVLVLRQHLPSTPLPYEPVAPQWMGTEPCYAAETNAHISAFSLVTVCA